MASNDGFIPYPIGLSANQTVKGIRQGYGLMETLKEYSHVSDLLDPPKGSIGYPPAVFDGPPVPAVRLYVGADHGGCHLPDGSDLLLPRAEKRGSLTGKTRRRLWAVPLLPEYSCDILNKIAASVRR